MSPALLSTGLLDDQCGDVPGAGTDQVNAPGGGSLEVAVDGDVEPHKAFSSCFQLCVILKSSFQLLAASSGAGPDAHEEGPPRAPLLFEGLGLDGVPFLRGALGLLTAGDSQADDSQPKQEEVE